MSCLLCCERVARPDLAPLLMTLLLLQAKSGGRSAKAADKAAEKEAAKAAKAKEKEDAKAAKEKEKEEAKAAKEKEKEAKAKAKEEEKKAKDEARVRISPCMHSAAAPAYVCVVFLSSRVNLWWQLRGALQPAWPHAQSHALSRAHSALHSLLCSSQSCVSLRPPRPRSVRRPRQPRQQQAARSAAGQPRRRVRAVLVRVCEARTPGAWCIRLCV